MANTLQSTKPLPFLRLRLQQSQNLLILPFPSYKDSLSSELNPS